MFFWWMNGACFGSPMGVLYVMYSIVYYSTVQYSTA